MATNGVIYAVNSVLQPQGKYMVEKCPEKPCYSKTALGGLGTWGNFLCLVRRDKSIVGFSAENSGRKQPACSDKYFPTLSFKATRKRWWACRSRIRNLQTGICTIQGKREKSLTVKLPKLHFGNSDWKVMSHSYADFQGKWMHVFHGMVHPPFLHDLII